MPNWVNNKLKVLGDADKLNAFLEKAIEQKNDKPIWRLSNTLPIPQQLENTSPDRREYLNDREVEAAGVAYESGNLEIEIPERIPSENNTPEKCKMLTDLYGADNWLDWVNLNWGIKWDCSTDEDNGYIIITTNTCFEVAFSSPWSPPGRWLLKMQAIYPELKFKLSYSEYSLGMAGVIYTGENGALLQEDGNFVLKDSSGRLMLQTNEGTIYEDTGEPAELPMLIYLRSTADDFIAWFEKE